MSVHSQRIHNQVRLFLVSPLRLCLAWDTRSSRRFDLFRPGSILRLAGAVLSIVTTVANRLLENLQSIDK